MTDNANGKTPLEAAKGYIEQLKDIEYHARDYLEKLAQLELDMDENLKNKKRSKAVGELFSLESRFQTELKDFIDDFEMECNRKQQEADKLATPESASG